MPFQIVRSDIVKMNVDAIVNAANSGLLAGGGVCGAIFSAAGERRLQAACDKLSPCPTGGAVITPGFDLPAKYVIHAVGPIWHGGSYGEEAQLYSCYAKSLRLADENGLTSIAFPLISSGIFGYPKQQAIEVALRAIKDFLDETDSDMTVYLILWDRKSCSVSKRLFNDIKEYVDDNYVDAHTDRTDRRDELRRHAGNFFPQKKNVSRPLEYSTPPDSSAAAYEDAPCAVFSESLDSAVQNMKSTFSQSVLNWIDKKNIKKDSIVYKRANIERAVFSKLRSNDNYVPSKSTAVALAVALELGLDDALDLLARAGYTLSPSNKGDVIVRYFIEHEIFDIYQINLALFDYGETCLGSKIS